jgi:hypothetical protein
MRRQPKGTKRAAASSNSDAGPLKRRRHTERGTESQPVVVDATKPSSTRQALDAASQATNFETQLRNSVLQNAITVPVESSEAATVAPTTTAASSDDEDTGLDEGYADDFGGIEWERLPKYMRPPRTSKRKKSWVYGHGYRVALRSSPSRIFWICRLCHTRKAHDVAGKIGVETTFATSSAAAHLLSRHRISRPSAPVQLASRGQKTITIIANSSVRVSQSVANELSSFNIQAFQIAAVS